MPNVEVQNPFATPKSPANQQEKNQVGHSNECLWLGIISIGGAAITYILPICYDEFSMGAFIAVMFEMLLYPIAGFAGVTGIAVGGIEAIAQLRSKSIFGQKETVFIGVALSFAGLAILLSHIF